LSHVDVFDVYEGPQVGEGKQSLAMHLEFRAPDRTLTEDDAHKLVDKILAALRDQLGAAHRG
jgi:phenylalanyl-tRNA synthetase beta chain